MTPAHAPGDPRPTSDACWITGLGAASGLGTGCPIHLEALERGRDGMRPIARFDSDDLAASMGATWPAWDGIRQKTPGPERDLERCAADFPAAELAIAAAREAWHDARLDAALATGAVTRERLALVLGTCFGQGFTEFHRLCEQVAEALGIGGPCLTVSTACASSTNAIGLARDLLRDGAADAVVAGGVDVLLREAFAGFSTLGVLSAGKCAPFSDDLGTTLGEGAGFVVVERSDGARARHARARGSVFGYGLSADAFHETTPDPNGAGVERAIAGALRDAGWSGDTVDYVNAHATGTANNDRIEWAAIGRALAPRGAPVLVSGSKGILGHTQGASGVLELVLCLLAMEHGAVPPTLHFRSARPGCPDDPVAHDRMRGATVARALKISSAFGGANAVLAFGPGSAAGPASPRPPRLRIPVAGVGIVGPAGTARWTDLSVDAPTLRGRAQEPALRRVVPTLDPRRLDRSSRLLTAAAALCLGEAGLAPRGEQRARTGLFVGATRMPRESAERCKQSIRLHGASRTSPAAFARMAVNAPAGACAKALSLMGPATTLTIGEGSGLLAIALAADWLASRDDTDCLVAGAVDEAASDDERATDGAVCVALTRPRPRPRHDATPHAPSVAGWAIAGPRAAAVAIERALQGAATPDLVVSDGLELDTLPEPLRCARHVRLGEHFHAAEASRSAFAFVLALAALQRGDADSALVVSAVGGSASCAVLVARGAPA